MILIQKNLFELLKPENDLEKTIIQDSEFKIGAEYGKPRAGHPEGQVKYHIREVLLNIDCYARELIRTKLRIVAFTHDTFKYQVDQSLPKIGMNNHGVLARKFTEKYTSDQDILEIVELHDEAYNAWFSGNKTGDWIKAEKRAKNLLTRLGALREPYITFFRCDNETGDKGKESYQWFKELVI